MPASLAIGSTARSGLLTELEAKAPIIEYETANVTTRNVSTPITMIKRVFDILFSFIGLDMVCSRFDILFSFTGLDMVCSRSERPLSTWYFQGFAVKMEGWRRSCFQVSIVGAVAEEGEKERLCGVGGRGKGGVFSYWQEIRYTLYYTVEMVGSGRRIFPHFLT
jgi:hypothetical protein